MFSLRNDATKKVMKLRKNIAISESGLIFNPVTGESYSVNPIGTEVLRLMQEDRNAEEITRLIQEKYTADQVTIEKDYSDFLGMLQHFNLMERDEETGL